MKLQATLTQYALICACAFGFGYLFCWSMTEPRVQTEIKEVKVKDVVTVVKEIKREERRPDGTVIVETETNTDKRSETRKDTQSVADLVKPQWSVGAYTNVNTDRFLLTVDRRIIGNVFVGVYGAYDVQRNDLSGGLGLRIEF